MSIKTSARKVKIVVGGEDFSLSFLEASNWQSSPMTQSGLITTTATITLIAVRGLPSSLDDRDNDLWRTGQLVEIDITTEDVGVWRRHPAGSLRIMTATYNPEERRLTLNCGCLLTLLNYRQPTDPAATEIRLGTKRDRSLIIISLLQTAGITNYELEHYLPHPLNYAIEISGSYLETVGKLLYSCGYIGWVDNTETFRIKPVRLDGNSVLTLQIGGDAGDETYYRRLGSPEAPREIIRVAGVTRIIQPSPFPIRSNSTRYGTASTVDSSLGNNTVVMAYTTVEETWDADIKLRRKTTITHSPIGLSLPNQEYTSPSQKLGLIVSVQTNDEWQYETTGQGKQLVVTTQVYKVIGNVLAEYVEDQKSAVFFRGLENVFLAETISTTYAYDALNRPLSITTTKHETEGALLAGTNMDWSLFSTYPTNLKPSEYTVESWREKRPGVWEHTIETYGPVSRLRPETITPDTTTEGRYALITDDQGSLREESNSGQTVPPAPERQPTAASSEDKQIVGVARFSQYGGNPYKERSRTYQIDYLEGAEAENKLFGALAQCQRIAQIEGALLYGRFKGQEIGTNLKDAFFDWEPLMRVNVIEPDGTQRAFVLDDAHWYLGSLQALCNFGAIWIGNASGVSRSLTVRTSGIAPPGTNAIPVEPVAGYIPEATVLNIDGVKVVTSAPTERGATALAIVPLTQPIPSNASATYIEPVFKLPYVQVQALAATGGGNVTVESRPYALTSTIRSVAAVGVGAIAVLSGENGTGPGFYWDEVTEEQWNSLTQSDWNNCFLSSTMLSWDAITEGEWNNISLANWNRIT